MKKFTLLTAVILAAALLAACGPAQTATGTTGTAAGVSASAPVTGGTTGTAEASPLKEVSCLSAVSTDFDNDGASETLSFEQDADGVTAVLTDGDKRMEYRLPQAYYGSQYVYCRGDGTAVLVDYDLASDDYETCFITYNGKQLLTVTLTGSVVSADSGQLRLAGTIEVLGSWQAVSCYDIDGALNISRTDDVYRITDWREIECAVELTLVKDGSGGETAAVPAGGSIIPVASNLRDTVWCRLPGDEQLYILSVTHSPDEIGFLVDGIPENEAFNDLRYYD